MQVYCADVAAGFRPNPLEIVLSEETLPEEKINLKMSDLFRDAVHLGHQTRFGHPKMFEYILGQHNRIHIINLEKTLPMFRSALKCIEQIAANHGTILFVGTKRQARDTIADEAMRAGSPYVNSRWLGGTLTNYRTLKKSIDKLKEMVTAVGAGALEKLTKKEALLFDRQIVKLEKAIGGLTDMGGMPDALFVIDAGYHKIAIAEANKLGIPVIAVVDTNHAPDGVDYVIPGNDDARKAIQLYAKQVADAILRGREKNMQGLVAQIREEQDVPAEDGAEVLA